MKAGTLTYSILETLFFYTIFLSYWIPILVIIFGLIILLSLYIGTNVLLYIITPIIVYIVYLDSNEGSIFYPKALNITLKILSPQHKGHNMMKSQMFHNEQVADIQQSVSINDTHTDIAPEPKIADHKVLHHILFYGGAGQGKTAFAKVIKHEISKYYGHDVEFIKVSPSQLTSKKQLDEVMLRVAENPYCILFVDEIHGMRRVIEESFYPALQDYEYDITLSDEVDIGDNMRFIIQRDKGVQTIKLPPFTCIGATTLIGEINKPLRDRFPILIEMDDYTEAQLVKAMQMMDEGDEPRSFDEYVGQDNAKRIVRYHLEALKNNADIKYKDDALDLIARIAFNTMRVAKQYKKNTTVIAKAKGKEYADVNDVKEMMKLYSINDDGLARPHLAIIKALIERWRHTPEGKSHALGSQALADIANVTKSDIEEIYVPILTKLGLLQRDGRSMKQLTPKAIEKYKNIF